MFHKKYFLISMLTAFSAVAFATTKSETTSKKPQQEIIEVTDKNFESVVLKAEKPVVIDFWAEWCGPCKTIKPTFEDLAKEHGDKYLFVTVNIDEAKETAIKYKIASIPTFVVIKNSTVHGVFVGGLKKDNFAQEVKKCLEKNPEKEPISNNQDTMLLMQAITMNNLEMIMNLIKSGVNVNHIYSMKMPIGKNAGKDYEFTPLSLALSLSNKELATIFLEAGASLDLEFKQNDEKINTRKFLELTKKEAVENCDSMIAFLDEYSAKQKSK